MTDATTTLCPACQGNAHRYNGCSRCDDSGRVPLPVCPVADEPRAAIAERIARDAAVDVKRALAHSMIDGTRREFVAPNVALSLRAGQPVARVVAYLRGEGLTEEHAYACVVAYVRSVEDFARRRPRRVETAKDVERVRVCAACDEHVKAIKDQLPALVRAVA